jgi:hypothetical protein
LALPFVTLDLEQTTAAMPTSQVNGADQVEANRLVILVRLRDRASLYLLMDRHDQLALWWSRHHRALLCYGFDDDLIIEQGDLAHVFQLELVFHASSLLSVAGGGAG